MSRRNTPACNWPRTFEIAPENCLTDKVKLSDLPADKRAAAFKKMQEVEPGMAAFVKQMAGTFGKSELFVDKDTAKRLGVEP